MPLGSDPLDELSIPDGTTVEEHDLVTDGDIIVGGQSTVEFGVRGHNVIAGERVQFGGHIEAEADCRLDMWSDIEDNVLVGRDAYLGERVHIGGRLMVSGDLDIGDDVDIEEGFEANGWIVIRNPMPTIVFVFVYLQQLLRIGEEEAAEEVMSELLENEEVEAEPVVVPRNGHVSDDSWRVSTPATIGDDCRLHGNIRAESIEVGRRNDVFGSLRARGDISVAEETVIHGDVTTRNGTVELADDVEIRGDVSCEDLHFHDGAVVDGTMRASGQMSMVQGGTHERIAADGDGGRKRFHGDRPGTDDTSDDGDGDDETGSSDANEDIDGEDTVETDETDTTETGENAETDDSERPEEPTEPEDSAETETNSETDERGDDPEGESISEDIDSAGAVDAESDTDSDSESADGGEFDFETDE
ncbi:polymer-forming cytoskeletal protein [Halorussus aquaticus]|uniref:Polymer-forming cytoskeletal protein n=1 Tax=Halorussus aquaticus TaxID=2953748 RepID=A0ABD5PY97_9EURY|nr:polymer-forming cytoskeletal protein [Halorussus aquaticus]